MIHPQIVVIQPPDRGDTLLDRGQTAPNRGDTAQNESSAQNTALLLSRCAHSTDIIKTDLQQSQRLSKA